MKNKRKLYVLLGLLISSITLHYITLDSSKVEVFYGSHFYDQFSSLLRRATSIFSFSVGDIFYTIAFCWLGWKLFRWVRGLFSKNVSSKFIIQGLLSFLIFVAAIYLIFNLMWGINYNRNSVEWKMGLSIERYSSLDLKKIDSILLDSMNSSKEQIVKDVQVGLNQPQLFATAIEAFSTSAKIYPFLQYKNPDIKSSMYGWLGNYAGFTGYYNPFTGEAQVNTTIPAFLQPYIVCHEVAHQIGFSKESEANFIAFIVSKNSKNELLKYSAYLQLYVYANSSLYAYDSSAAKRSREKISAAVKKDIDEWRKFNKSHVNKFEPMTAWVYDLFLKNNQQPQGLLSYEGVVGLLINYYKKNGSL